MTTDSEQSDFGGVEPELWDTLYDIAVDVRDNAYAAYSEFPVGAAILTKSGEIFRGCNVENATIGATVCAERTAIGNAIAHGHRDIRALCVVTDLAEPAAPCGICRQVLAEFSGDLPILMANLAGDREFTTLDTLLPHRFTRRDVKAAQD